MEIKAYTYSTENGMRVKVPNPLGPNDEVEILFVEWVYETKKEAKDVLDQMYKLIASDGLVSVATFYELFTDSCPPKEFEDIADTHVYTTLEGAYISDYSIEKHGYVLNLPKPYNVLSCLPTINRSPNYIRKLIDLKPIDMVKHPPHYQSKTGLEVIDVIEAFTSDLQGIEATDTGNIIKYICRWKHKNGVQDLDKAKWYLEHLISRVKEKENEK